MKVALVHDHLAQDGGAEATLRAMAEMFPDAPIFVLVYNKKRAHPYFLNRDIRTSFLQRVPLGLKRYQWFFPLMPQAVESFDFSDYDLVLSSSSSFAKGILIRPETLHVCYCHTPTRFLWSDTHSYIRDLRTNFVFKWLAQIFFTHLRLWDRNAAERMHYLLANSKVVQSRIQKYYKRGSTVMYPPVNISEFRLADPKNYFLTGGRLVSYKRFDLVVEAFNKLGRPLKIFGDGPELDRLQSVAKKNIEFLGRVSDEQKKILMSEALAFLNPQEEDFGITMIESMASGRPVIAYRKGGATEIVNEKTGMFFDYQTWEDLANAILLFQPEKFDSQEIRKYAERFDVRQFQSHLKTFIDEKLKEFKKSL